MTKTTVDINTLITEYLVCKVQNGYNTEITSQEFSEFLSYAKDKIDIEDELDEASVLFKKLFYKKRDCFDSEFYHDNTLHDNFHKPYKHSPTMTLDYNSKSSIYSIKAGIHLSIYSGLRYEYEKKDVDTIILDFLSSEPKRVIDETKYVSDQELYIGKCIAAKIVDEIWDRNIRIKGEMWPTQCRDINKYLLKMDLATIIGLKSIKDKLLNLYCVLSKRIAVLYNEDKSLGISSYENGVLAHQNFKLMSEGFEDLIGYVYWEYGKSLEIDLSSLKIEETYEYGASYYDEDSNYRTDTTFMDDKYIQELVIRLDKAVNDNSKVKKSSIVRKRK